MRQLFSIRGKTALVTGSTRGIGLMIASALAEAGARTYVSSRDPDMCAEVAAQLTAKFDGDCFGRAADLACERGVQELADFVKQREDRLDILVNNASLHKLTPIAETRFEDFAELTNANVASMFMLTRELLPLLRSAASKQDPARIINMGSSIVLENAAWDSFVYAASKAAIHQISRDLANELAADFITVNCLAPSAFPSRMVEHYLSADFTMDDVAARVPLQRVGGADDMAGVVLFLCSRAGAFLTGNVISNDGGTAIR